MIKIEDLRTDYQENPIGLDTKVPRFSWKIKSSVRAVKQTAFEILTAESSNKLSEGIYLWTSGKQTSNCSVGVKYTGKGNCQLKPYTRYYWKVKVWDQNDRILESEDAFFETGLMSTDGVTNWDGARWITDNQDSTNPPGVTMFRTERILGEKSIGKATLYITSLGIYNAFINGEKVKLGTKNGEMIEETFNPGWTDYKSYVNYQTYDVTNYLYNHSSVSLAVMLGKGWFAGRIGEVGGYTRTVGNKLALLAKLVVTFRDGSKKIIVTDDNHWKSCTDSPILENDFYEGEIFDAIKAKSLDGWNNVQYDDSQWNKVSIFNYKGKVKGNRSAAARIAEEYTLLPIAGFTYSTIEKNILKGGKSTYSFGHAITSNVNIKRDISLKVGETLILDMGQNFAGVPQITVTGSRGTTMKMRYAEMLNDGRINPNSEAGGSDGPKDTLYRKALTTAAQTDKYIFAGDEDETYKPQFTFHGYRYMEITADKDVIVKAVTGNVITSVGKQIGKINTSDKEINKLFNNILWGQISNYLSIPTDSPQRAERVGWSGDVQIFAQTGIYNFDVISFLENYNEIMDDYNKKYNNRYGSIMPDGFFNSFSETLAAGWGDSGIIIPWVLYQQTGDETVIRKSFQQMNKYMDYVGANGYNTELFGDWLAFQATSTKFLNTVYRAYVADLMRKMAKVIENKSMISKYENLFNEIKAYFTKKYFDDKANLLTATADKFENSHHNYPGADNAQTGLLWALKLSLYDTEEQKDKMKINLTKNIRNENSLIRKDQPENTLAVGFLGVNVLLPVLSDLGLDKLAYTLLLQDKMPSWLYSVKNGATTIWERWNSYSMNDSFGDSSMNSFNHYSYGAVAEWMYKYMAGISINPDFPGFQHFILHPKIDKDNLITWVEGSYDSVYGIIESKWKLKNNTFTYTISVPANTIATVYIPTYDVSVVTEGGLPIIKGKDIKYIEYKNGNLVCEVKSGIYEFQSLIKPL